MSNLLLLGCGGSSASAGGGGAWAPSDLGATLRGWYKGDEVAGSNNDPISPWSDASGNALNLTQATSGLRGTLITANLDGKNVLRFTGSSTQWYTVPSSVFSGATAGSAYFVIKVATDPPIAANTGLWRIGSASGGTGGTHYPWTDSVIYDTFGTNARKTVGNPTPALTGWRIIGVHSAASDYGYRIDGVSFFTTATNTVGWEPSNAGFGRTDNGIGGFNYLDGWVAELIFVNSKLSDANREKVEGYLAHKWGLEGSLDSGHTYKSAPP